MRIVFTISFVLMTLLSKAQNEIAPIILDRPDLTESPYLVPKNYFQMESGILFQNDKSNSQQMKLPTSLWKYGLTDNLELRLITDFDGSIENKGYGLSPIWIGFKAPLVEEKGIVPKISIISHLQIPTLASSFYKAKYIAPQFRFVFQHTISEKVSLSYNLGMEWDGFSPQQTYIYTLTSGISLTKRIGMYLELYGDFQRKDVQGNYHADGGFTYLINNNSMFDISSGFKYLGVNKDYFLSCGYSFRFNTKRK